MKKIALLSIIALAVALISCKSKTAENADQPKDNTEIAKGFVPECIETLVNADWDAVPQELLDAMGMKPLNSFKQEVKDAQVDNLQYYFGKGAEVELDNEGHAVKITDKDDDAVVIYLTAESVAYGTIAFRSEADYNEFLKKAQAIKESKEKAGQEVEMEFVGIGKNVGSEDRGYDEGEWYFVEYTYDK